MNTVIKDANGRPSKPLRSYCYVHDSSYDSPAKSGPGCTHNKGAGYNCDSVIMFVCQFLMKIIPVIN